MENANKSCEILRPSAAYLTFQERTGVCYDRFVGCGSGIGAKWRGKFIHYVLNIYADRNV